jgi:hypothetical protein
MLADQSGDLLFEFKKSTSSARATLSVALRSEPTFFFALGDL